jgi:hypothetical protein
MNQEAKIDPLVELVKAWYAERPLWNKSQPYEQHTEEIARSLLQALRDWTGDDGSKVVRLVGCRNLNHKGCTGCEHRIECEATYVDHHFALPLIGKEG